MKVLQTIISNNNPIDTIVGSFIVYDYGEANNYFFTLVDGEGDNSLFFIVSNQLITNVEFTSIPLNFIIRVRATENATQLFIEKIFIIILLIIEDDDLIFEDIDIVFEESNYLNCPLCEKTQYSCSNDSK
jgi:hypothetical protein